MRINYKAYLSKCIKSIDDDIRNLHRVTNRKLSYVEVDGFDFMIRKSAEAIACFEVVTSFLIENIGHKHISMNDILSFFRTTTNSDVVYFESINKNGAAKLHHILFGWEYKASVEQALMEYNRLPNHWKAFSISQDEEGRYIYSLKNDANSCSRYDLYIDVLEEPLLHQENPLHFGKIQEGKLFQKTVYIKDNTTGSSFVFDLPDELLNYAKHSWSPYTIDTDPREQEEISLTKVELIEWANSMDELDARLEKQNNWAKRIQDLVFSMPGADLLEDKEEFKINGTHHVVGALSVGKSTFINVCTFGLTRKKKRIAIFLNTVTDVLKLVDYMNELQVKAVPLLSNRQIGEHSNQYISSIKTHHDLFSQRASLKYINDSCMLSSIAPISTIGTELFKYPPCTTVYYNNDGREEKTLCPFICSCPRYNNIRDLNDADVIVSTINSAVCSNISAPFAQEKMKILEYIIRTCDLVFIDESDQVQASLDGLFLREIDIYGGSDVLYKRAREVMFEHQENGTVPDEDIVDDYMRGIYAVEYYSSSIARFLHSKQNSKDIIKDDDVYDKLIKSQILWREMFREVVGVDFTKDEEKFKKDEEFSSQFYEARKAFGNAFEIFQKNFLSGLMPEPTDDLSFSLRNIAVNIMDEVKLKFDIDRFINTPLCRLLRYEDNRVANKCDFYKLQTLVDNWDKSLVQILKEGVASRIRFILELYMLELKLRLVIKKIEIASRIESRLAGDLNTYIGSFKHEYAGVVPALPIDMNYGFLIRKEKVNGETKIHIKYVNLEGVGRWVLLNFGKLYRDLDGVQTNCILLSGTSNMLKSPKYNLEMDISCLLRKKDVRKPKLHMYYPNSIVTKVSGMGKVNGNENVKVVARNLLNDKIYPTGVSYLQTVFDRLDETRKKVLFSLGSYKECEVFSEELNKDKKHNKEFYYLVRPDGERKEGARVIERSKIEDVPKYKIDGLAIPLSSGRGYNILTTVAEIDELMADADEEMIPNKSRMVAAMGAVFFAKRPYYIPSDMNTLVSWLNSTYVNVTIEYRGKTRFIDIEEYRTALISALHATMYQFENMFGYRTLTVEQRNKLLGDTLVDVYQLACRLIRGDVNAEIHFIDSSFAPNSAVAGKDLDSEETSMLVGWKKMLHSMIHNYSQTTSEINRELYMILYEGLCEISLKEEVSQ